MKKKINSGFSIVEVLIALAIFLILMIPISQGIIQALNLTTGSKELQYRNEFAKGVMEHVKSAEISEMLDSEYYVDAGTDASSFTTSQNDGVIVDGEGNDCEYAQYEIKGTVEIGLRGEKYNYLVDVDNYEYVNNAATAPDDVEINDPNNMAYGIIQDLDKDKVAIIGEGLVNCDKEAESTLLGRKLTRLNEDDPVRYQQIMAQPDPGQMFLSDQGYRLLTIHVSGNADEGYSVKGIVDYFDSCSVLGYEGQYEEEFFAEFGLSTDKVYEGKVPNIYVMYNPCFYNNAYATDDYILIDTSELENKDDKVNVFLIETASNYSDSIVDAGGVDAANEVRPADANPLNSDDRIYFDNDVFGRRRNDVKIHLAAAVGTGANASKLSNIHVYSNIGDNTRSIIDENGDKTEVDRRNLKSALDRICASKSGDYMYKGVALKKAINTDFNHLYDYMKVSVHDKFDQMTLTPLVGNGDDNDATLGFLSDATNESRGLYNVKVYMKKVSDGAIDKATDKPILEGTKGGNES
ncbi:MAG: type II secretion system protein J [Lachnospiraceae bacterium]